MRRKKSATFAAVLLCLGLGMAACSGAAFLKMGDIKGEGTDSTHKNWIVVEAINHGIVEETATGLPTGKRLHKPLVITKPVDIATPLLMEACVSGKATPLVRMEFVTQGSRELYYQIVLNNVLVGSYQTSGPSGEAVPMDSFSLNYDEIKWTYTQFDPESQPVRDHSYYWNLLSEMGESDELPPGSFRVTGGGAFNPDGEVLRLQWTGYEEFRYVILAATSVQGPYLIVRTHDPLADGKQMVELPIDMKERFFRIEKLPLPQ